MESAKYVRKPFIVEATEVTEENIAEIATLVGTLKEKEDGTPYIQVNRNVVPGVYRVYPGFWMTRLGDNIRCYAKKIFSDQFCENTEDIEQWINYINETDVTEIEPVDEEAPEPEVVSG